MGKGYRRYWLAVLGIGVPFLAYGVWRLFQRTSNRIGADDDWAVVESLIPVASVAALAVLVLIVVALPFDFRVRRLKREFPHGIVFLARRNTELSSAIESFPAARPLDWSYWIVVVATPDGLDLYERPTRGKIWRISSSQITQVELGLSKTNRIPVPALVVSLKIEDGVAELPLVPTTYAFSFGWSETRIEAAVASLRRYWRAPGPANQDRSI